MYIFFNDVCLCLQMSCVWEKEKEREKENKRKERECLQQSQELQERSSILTLNHYLFSWACRTCSRYCWFDLLTALQNCLKFKLEGCEVGRVSCGRLYVQWTYQRWAEAQAFYYDFCCLEQNDATGNADKLAVEPPTYPLQNACIEVIESESCECRGRKEFDLPNSKSSKLWRSPWGENVRN